MKKIISIIFSFTLILCVFTACSSTGTKVYFLNFKPEVAEVYGEIAKKYEEETGVHVKVSTSASGTYEQTLKSEIAKSDAPTIFQINGPVGYSAWKDYTEDLSDTKLYSLLTDKNLAISDGDGIYGIPFAIEAYGIIYNDAILQKYFSLADSKFSSIDEIKSFESLKTLVEDMQNNKSELGIEGVFASTSLVPGEEWRWHTHLANIPLSYEFENNNIDLNTSSSTDTIEFKYIDNFKNLFDLYTDNSITEKTQLGTKSVDDSMAEFAMGKVAMVQNGNWAWSQINGISGNTVEENDIKFLPMYTGIEGEENQGLAIGTENYFAINKNASAEDKKASIDFLEWLYTSETGKALVTEELGFIAPFTSFSEEETPSDPLAKQVVLWSENEEVKNIPWNFTIMPSSIWKDNFGADLLAYTQGRFDFEDMQNKLVEDWQTEKQNAK